MQSPSAVQFFPLASLPPQVCAAVSQIRPPAQSEFKVQLALQKVASAQTKPPGHAVGVAAGHAAVGPLQDFADVNVLPEHDCARHCAVEVAHAPDVHVPVTPQGVAAPHCGSAVPLGSFVHVPTLAGTLHA